MRRRIGSALSSCLFVATAAPAQVLRATEMNTSQLRALDRSRTAVFLLGGMMEEHGPYLPAFTDGILSERLLGELLKAFTEKKPGWTALVLPAVSVGASGYNEFGGHYVFPGTFTIRPSTLGSLFMDLGDDLLRKNPLFNEWFTTGEARDAGRQSRQQAWIAKRR